MTTIVLNGTSSSGKTTLAEALRASWPGHLQISGLDTFLACQSESMFAPPGSGVRSDGFTWQQVRIDGVDCFDVVAGAAGEAMLRAAHTFWAASADEGIDQVVDHVLLSQASADDLRRRMAGRDVLYVGVRCPADLAEAREIARGDRIVGQARGLDARVHGFMAYDLEVDTSVLTPAELAAVILTAVRAAAGP